MVGKRKELVYGVGRRNQDTQITKGGVRTRPYIIWTEMLKRCFCPKERARIPSYSLSTCCEEWLQFENFKEWLEPKLKEGWELDKDILVKGNKHYSPATCLVVPARINCMAVVNGKGYYWNKSMQKWHAQISVGTAKARKTQHLGFFTEEQEAELAYKQARKKLLLSRKAELDATDARILPCLLRNLEDD